MKRTRQIIAGLLLPLLSLGMLVVTAPPSAGASGASFTTDINGEKVNANHYTDKCAVYLNGGPDGAQLAAGNYVFFVLPPGGQHAPNEDKLSTDDNSNRDFSVDGDGNVTYVGTHPTSEDATNDELLIGACIPGDPVLGYNDTPNPGGVYILAICEAGNQTPSGCKYDAFKVRPAGEPVEPIDLIVVKTAIPSFTRTYDFSIDKNVDKTYVQASGGSATFNYTVDVTKDAGTDSAFALSGTIQVFNLNEVAATGVTASDAIPDFDGETCTVTGGMIPREIAAGESTTFDYTCTLPAATAATAGTNEATVNWLTPDTPNQTATDVAPFDFATATPTEVDECTTVTDTFGLSGTTGTTEVLGQACATKTFTYARTVDIPARACKTYDNTARLSDGDTADRSVTVCRVNAGGFTIGFWQNKNGQAKLASYAPALCTYLAQYGNVLGDLPANCNKSSLPAYVTTVIKAANSSGDGVLMFKAQFLATAINAYFSPALANTTVPTLDGCKTVSTVLTYANAEFNNLKANKSNLLAYKDVFDRINNNSQVTC